MMTSSKDSEQVWTQWKQQLTAYVQWINSQLKKKPGAHLVEDLRHDVRDGVALIDLLEVIAGERLPDSYPAPSTYGEMRANIDKVLHFMAASHIKMHHITTRDIVDGNLKAIMRLILALAAHYKPHSVRHSGGTSSKAADNTFTGLAQGAAAALTEARRTASRAGQKYRRRKRREEEEKAVGSDSDTGNQCSSSSRRRSHKLSDGGHKRTELEGASSSPPTSPRHAFYGATDPGSTDILVAPATTTSCDSDNTSGTDSGFKEMFTSVHDARLMLVQLQDLLLQGGTSNTLEEDTQGETMDELKTKLQASEEDGQRVREELVELKKKIEGRDTVMGDLRASCVKQIEDKDKMIANLRREVMKRDTALEQLKAVIGQNDLGGDHYLNGLDPQPSDLSWRPSTGPEGFKPNYNHNNNLVSTPTPDRQHHSNSNHHNAHMSEKRSRNYQSFQPTSTPPPPPPPPRSAKSLIPIPRNSPPRDNSNHHPIPTSVIYSSPPRGGQVSTRGHGTPSQVATQVLYFTEQSEHPHSCVIRKKLGEITLGDLKRMIGGEHNHLHYFFKALDPEYGTVKEELCMDDDKLPGWEGRIVAWLETDKAHIF